MAVDIYDRALAQKLQAWTKNTNLKIYTADNTKRLYEVLADEKDDGKIELPMLSIRRTGGYKIKVPRWQPLAYDGFTREATIEKSFQINAIPIQLQYQLDLYTREYRDADEYMRNILFNLINFPQLIVYAKYNEEEIEFHSAIEIADQVEDTSEITERMVQGQFTRLTLGLSIDDAYLWDFRVRDNYIICVDVVDTYDSPHRKEILKKLEEI